MRFDTNSSLYTRSRLVEVLNTSRKHPIERSCHTMSNDDSSDEDDTDIYDPRERYADEAIVVLDAESDTLTPLEQAHLDFILADMNFVDPDPVEAPVCAPIAPPVAPPVSAPVEAPIAAPVAVGQTIRELQRLLYNATMENKVKDQRIRDLLSEKSRNPHERAKLARAEARASEQR